MSRTCSSCGKSKKPSEYLFNDKSGRYSYRCVECGPVSKARREFKYKSLQNYLRHLVNKARCGTRGVQVDLTIDDVLAIYERQGGKCAVTGLELTHSIEDTSRNVSMDRINCNRHYAVDNVRLVCATVNIMRNRLSDEDLGFWAMAVVKGMGLCK